MKDFTLQIVMWATIVIGLGILLGFVAEAENQLICKEIIIDIDESNQNFFVKKEEIHAMVYHEMDTLLGRPIAAINAQRLEHKIQNHSSIEEAQVYKTIDGELRIEVRQRTPILRVFNKDGTSFYLDSLGKVMPTSQNYTSRVLIANGEIQENNAFLQDFSILNLPDSMANRTQLDELFAYANFIRKNAFWTAQIEQLFVNKEFELELIPRVGNHRIVFGDASSIPQKFKKLELFYDLGLSKTGWNEYEVINIKYADQVVCTKR